MNILLCSAGRRPYIVRWFKEALIDNGIEGCVITADVDAFAASKVVADEFVQAPAASSESYPQWLSDVLKAKNISIAISVNDFELSVWANLPNSEDYSALVRLDVKTQEVVEDKLEMAMRLDEVGVPSPRTWTGLEAKKLEMLPGKFVTKGRFGSASRGLRFSDAQGIVDAVSEATKEVTNRWGELALEQDDFEPENLVVIQQLVEGVEFGLDVVCDWEGKFASVLARQKVSMRSGETDKATSVPSAQFEEVAKLVATAVPHRGLIDVDVIVDPGGRVFVIDVNPRFGGGYPFSHLAGARIPSAYVAWADNRDPHLDWLESLPGVSSSKYVETVVVS
ncbi:ATP-grasp domain-containing protein [Corynebacterium glutamicum]|uniref:ATP-grasp domain-containing protein n=1 Tax=Corynebacterium glutamicum TaxID=1718 RepID=UPI001B8D6F43|nr:ATP-grasp domain-containing protein [Corynebacterium glutamicum]